MEIPHICRYCGGIVRLVPAESVYGDSAVRLGLKGEKLYQCQNCNARVGCHRGTVRPLGDLANEVLRLKRIETHQVFDAYWTERGMSRTQAYRWLAKKMHLPERKAHIGGFEMHQCQKLIDLCRGNNETKEDVISRRETPTPASRKQPSARCSEMAPYPAPAWVKNISWPLKPWRFTSPAAFPKIQKRRR